jgi:hypothetical protein
LADLPVPDDDRLVVALDSKDGGVVPLVLG